MNKKFISCMYLYKEKAVAGFADKNTVIDKDPVTLAKFYSDNNADELLVFDLSDSDAEHETALDLIKKICSVVEIPVIGAGNVKRMEDIKKLIYAGCKKAALPRRLSPHILSYSPRAYSFTLSNRRFVSSNSSKCRGALARYLRSSSAMPKNSGRLK